MVVGYIEMEEKYLVIVANNQIDRLRISPNHFSMVSASGILDPAQIITIFGLVDGTSDQYYKLDIQFPNHGSLSNFLYTITLEIYKKYEHKVTYKFEQVEGFNKTKMFEISKQNVINGIVSKKEEIVRVPILKWSLRNDLKLKFERRENEF